MALFYPGIWEGGEPKKLGVGTHYDVYAKSITVEEGEVVRFYDTVEDDGKETFPWYENKYLDTSFYPIKHGNHKRVVIEETPLLRKQMAIAKWRVQYEPGKYYTVSVPLTTEHAFLNFWTGSTTGGIDFLNDKIERLYVPEGLTIKVFKDHLDVKNAKKTPGIVISGPKEFDFNSASFKSYHHTISAISIGGVTYKLLSMEVDESSAEWKSYTTIGGKQRAENDTPNPENAVGVEIDYNETKSQTDGWQAGFGIEQSNTIKFGNEASFVQSEFGVTFKVDASWSGETGEEKSQAAIITANATPGAYAACDCEVIVEMKRGKVNAIRRFVNMETGAVVEQPGVIEFDMYADATTRFSNYVELQTPAAVAWRAEQEAKQAVSLQK